MRNILAICLIGIVFIGCKKDDEQISTLEIKFYAEKSSSDSKVNTGSSTITFWDKKDLINKTFTISLGDTFKTSMPIGTENDTIYCKFKNSDGIRVRLYTKNGGMYFICSQGVSTGYVRQVSGGTICKQLSSKCD